MGGGGEQWPTMLKRKHTTDAALTDWLTARMDDGGGMGCTVKQTGARQAG